ncbi:DUF3108 domain-containing protein [Chitinophagaceae bacterium LB-8]|uniref:DUF3108 domain-containing protein n=1 Tax=Paraflavisolibacter caeni TaxID=2982496 RepID=A0A9X3BGE2_9BACT|nr:DUF3108 domain-containing protein [Paraflavisolibacter caeni]MCU7547612.1 DUF3108 domain-containing protein [Paraflavisolibacter caeni]
MKMLRLMILFIFFGLHSNAQDFAFKAGEKITYTVFYNVIGLYINAGTATFSTTRVNFQNYDAYHVVGEGSTNSKYDWIFKVRDRYESYFDADDLKPIKFIRNVNEGDYKKYEEVVFDHDNKIAITKKGMIKIPHQVQDVISSLYYARNLDFNNYKPGDKIPFNMFLGDEVYNMYIRYVGKESVKTKYGNFNAIKIKPLLLKGQTFNGGEKMTIWVTDDPNHIPVRIESPIVVGTVKVDLVEYQNLKHPLTALTKKK